MCLYYRLCSIGLFINHFSKLVFELKITVSMKMFYLSLIFSELFLVKNWFEWILNLLLHSVQLEIVFSSLKSIYLTFISYYLFKPSPYIIYFYLQNFKPNYNFSVSEPVFFVVSFYRIFIRY